MFKHIQIQMFLLELLVEGLIELLMEVLLVKKSSILRLLPVQRPIANNHQNAECDQATYSYRLV